LKTLASVDSFSPARLRADGEKTPEEQARWNAIDFGQLFKFSPKRRRRGGSNSSR
jgi:hypothetical protein